MVKVLRISDDLHQKVKYLAEKDRRTINAMAEILLETGMGVPFTGNTPLPKNTDISNLPDVMQTDEMLHDKVMPAPLYPEKKIDGASPDRVDDLFASPDSELPCCKNENKPCKHWVWDTATGEGYKNSLSGRFLEVE